MQFKTVVKSLLPPILTDAIRARAGVEALPSWQAACEAAGSYEADTINSFRIRRSEARKVDGSVLLESILGLVSLLLEGCPELSVTDFGGATGDLGQDFLAAYPDARYTVVENPKMVALMAGKSAVRFSTEIPQRCHIFFTSSTLQYLNDPMAVLAKGMDSASDFVILVRNSFSESEIFHVQRWRLFAIGIGPVPEGFCDQEITYPHRTLNESKIMALAQSRGFKCIARLEEHSGAMGNAYGKQLVFRRLPPP